MKKLIFFFLLSVSCLSTTMDFSSFSSRSTKENSLLNALENNNEEEFQQLLATNYKNLSDDKKTKLVLAATEGEKKWALRLLAAQEADLNTSDRQRMFFSPLMVAIILNKPEMLHLLLELGANINARHQNSLDTALLTAIKNQRFTLAESLIALHADPNLADTEGITPLILAAALLFSLHNNPAKREAYFKLFKDLLIAGANPFQKTNSTAVMAPKNANTVDIINALPNESDRASALDLIEINTDKRFLPVSAAA